MHMIIEKEIKTNKGTVYYWVSEAVDNAKDTLFFMHGMTADHSMFDWQVEFFEASAAYMASIMDDNHIRDKAVFSDTSCITIEYEKAMKQIVE